MKLKSIAEEMADCRTAFEGVEVGAAVQHCHHDKLIEYLVHPPEERIANIYHEKPVEEQAQRFRSLRPWAEKLPAVVEAARVKAFEARKMADAAAARVEVCTVWVKGFVAWMNAKGAWEKANEAWESVVRENLPELEAQYWKHNPDSSWDGKTIFGRGVER